MGGGFHVFRGGGAQSRMNRWKEGVAAGRTGLLRGAEARRTFLFSQEQEQISRIETDAVQFFWELTGGDAVERERRGHEI